MAQDQRSVTEQLRKLAAIANNEGLYDAADWLYEQFCDCGKIRCSGPCSGTCDRDE